MDDRTPDARYAPPQSHVEDVVAPGTGPGQPATRGKRLAAALIDGGIAIAVFYVLARLTPINIWAGARDGMWAPRYSSAAAGYVVFLILQGYLLVTRGQTIGKALMKLRIVRPDGSLPSAGRLLGLRYGIAQLLAVVPAVGQVYALVDCLLIFRKSRRCLHDQIADTVVLQA